MTPQATFMVMAPIEPRREAELRELLASMNNAPGCVNARNALIPFAEFDTLHFARFLIVGDKTLDDIRLHDLPTRTYPLYLAFLGDLDGDRNIFLEELARRASTGLRAIFSCCDGFPVDSDLLGWMKEHSVRSAANYVNWPGRTVRRVREDAALREVLDLYMQSNVSALAGWAPRQIHARLREHVDAETAAGRLTLSAASPTPPGWQIANLLHMIGVPCFLSFRRRC